MPTATPVWRKVSLAPTARPDCSRRQRLQSELARRRVEEACPGAREQKPREDHGPRGVHVEHQHARHAHPEEHQPKACDLGGRRVRAELSGHSGDDEDQERPGQIDEPGLDRRHTEDRLQVKGRVEEDGEERRGDGEHRHLGPGEPALAQQPQRQHRLPRARLDDHERDEEHGGASQRGDDASAPPAFLVAAQQREDQQEKPADERELAGHVDAPGRRVLALGNGPIGHPQRDGADRHVDQEDRAPAEELGQRAADEWPERERGADRRTVDGQRLHAVLPRGRHLPDQCERRREHHRRAQALDRAGADQHLDPAGSAAERGARGEQHQAEREQAPATEAVGDRARREHGRRERDRVRVDHPLEAAEPGVEPGWRCRKAPC